MTTTEADTMKFTGELTGGSAGGCAAYDAMLAFARRYGYKVSSIEDTESEVLSVPYRGDAQREELLRAVRVAAADAADDDDDSEPWAFDYEG